jgi:hypothetical protein
MADIKTRRRKRAESSEIPWNERRLMAEAPAPRQCWSCGAATQIERRTDIDPAPWPPPLWMVEGREWTMEYGALCAECMGKGERIPLCFEGGTLHRFADFGSGPSSSSRCVDCGYDVDRHQKERDMGLFVRARLECAIAARLAEIRVSETWLPKLTGRARNATAMRLVCLREDFNWCRRQLAGDYFPLTEVPSQEVKAAGRVSLDELAEDPALIYGLDGPVLRDAFLRAWKMFPALAKRFIPVFTPKAPKKKIVTLKGRTARRLVLKLGRPRAFGFPFISHQCELLRHDRHSACAAR